MVGPTAPLVPGKIGAIAIHADGTRQLVKLIPDPLTRPSDAEESPPGA